MTGSQTTLIKNALLDIETIELEKFDSLTNIPFTTSKEYNEKINKLIESERIRESSILKLSMKKKVTILIASALILLITLTACIFKEEILDFLISYKNATIQFSSSENKKLNDYVEYEFTFIPDGYSLVDSVRTERNLFNVYQNSKHILSLDQSGLSAMVSMDNEDNSYKTTVINEHTVYYTHTKSTYKLIWKTETNIFTITCHDSLSWEEIEKIIINAAPIR